MQAYGAEVRLNTEAPSVEELHKMGYTHILYATGAWKPGKLNIPGNVRGVIGWMQERKAGANEPLGHVAVVGRRPTPPWMLPAWQSAAARRP